VISKSPPVYRYEVVKEITGPKLFGVPPVGKLPADNVRDPLRTVTTSAPILLANVKLKFPGSFNDLLSWMLYDDHVRDAGGQPKKTLSSRNAIPEIVVPGVNPPSCVESYTNWSVRSALVSEEN
jgi:hypothetical protein